MAISSWSVSIFQPFISVLLKYHTVVMHHTSSNDKTLIVVKFLQVVADLLLKTTST